MKMCSKQIYNYVFNNLVFAVTKDDDNIIDIIKNIFTINFTCCLLLNIF